MLVTRPIKSITDGVSTSKAKVRNRKYLAEQTNISIIEESGLHRRPPTSIVSAELDSFFNDNVDTQFWAKEFSMTDVQYFLIGMWSDTTLNEQLITVTADGTKASVPLAVGTTFDYLKTTSENIELTVNGDTVYIVNKTIVPTKISTPRGQHTNTHLVVTSAPPQGSTITVTWKDILGTDRTVTITVAQEPHLERTSTDYIALQLTVAINAQTLTEAYNRGSSVVLILNADWNDVTVTDSQNSDLVKVIKEETDDILDLPKFAYIPDALKQVATKIGEDADNAIYMGAEETSDSLAVLTADFQITTGTVLVGTITYRGYSTSLVIGTITTPFVVDGVTLDHLVAAYDSATNKYWLEVQGTGGFNNAGDIMYVAWQSIATADYVTHVEPTGAAGNWSYRVDTDFSAFMTSGVAVDFYMNQPLANVNPLFKEVKWKETSAPTEAYRLDWNKLPHLIENISGVWVIGEIPWEDKTAGNDINNPDPDFLGRTIHDIKIFQNRLVALTGDLVNTTETDNLFSWWRSTTSQLLSTHPVRIFSTVKDSSKLHTAINNDRDLLIFSQSRQFKLSGEIPLTPASGLPVTTSYPNLSSARPISLGTRVYFPFEYATDSFGIAEYVPRTGTDSRDTATPITDHVKGYLSSSVDYLTGDANVGKLIAANFETNTLYMCDFDETAQGVAEGNRKKAWHTWQLSLPTTGTGTKIISLAYHRSTLSVVVLRNGVELDLLQIDLTESPEIGTPPIYADTSTTGSVTSVTPSIVTVPAPLDSTGEALIFYVIDTGNPENARILPATQLTSNTWQLDEDRTIAEVIGVGLRFDSELTLSQEFVRDQGGKVNHKTRLTIQQWLVHLENSADLTASLVTPLLDKPDDQYWSGNVTGSFETITGESPHDSGIFGVAAGERSELITLKLKTDGVLPFNISQIELDASYSSHGRRF